MLRFERATPPARQETLRRLSAFTRKPLLSTSATIYCTQTGLFVCLFFRFWWDFGQSDFMLEKGEFCQRGGLFGRMSTACLRSASRCKTLKVLTVLLILLIMLITIRSAAYIKMGQFTKAHQDAVKAKELNSEWPKVKYHWWGCWNKISKCNDQSMMFASPIPEKGHFQGSDIDDTYCPREYLFWRWPIAVGMEEDVVWSMRAFSSGATSTRFSPLAFTALISNSI